MNDWIQQYLDAYEGQIMGIFYYSASGEKLGGVARYTVPQGGEGAVEADAASGASPEVPLEARYCDFGLEPTDLCPVMFTEQGIERLTQHGCTVGVNRMRFIVYDDGDETIRLAGPGDKEAGWVAAGAILKKMDDGNVAGIAHNANQQKGPFTMAAMEIFDILENAGY